MIASAVGRTRGAPVSGSVVLSVFRFSAPAIVKVTLASTSSVGTDRHRKCRRFGTYLIVVSDDVMVDVRRQVGLPIQGSAPKRTTRRDWARIDPGKYRLVVAA